MAINAYDRTSFAQFQPISPEMMMMPAQYMRQQEDQLAEDANQLQLLNSATKAQLIQGVDDNAIASAQEIDNNIKNLAESLTKEGFNAIGRRSGINKLRSSYNTTMLPIQQAVQARAEVAKFQQQALLQNPSIRFTKLANDISADEAIANPQIFSQIQGINGAALRQTVAQKVAPIAKMLADVAPQTMQIKGPNGRPIAYQYTQAYQRGATPEEVAALMVRDGVDPNSASKISLLLSNAIEGTMESAGVYDLFGRDSKEANDLYTETASGAYAALGSPEIKNITDAYGMQTALMSQRAAASAKEKQNKPGNYYPSFYRANVASKEIDKLGKIEKNLTEYIANPKSKGDISSVGQWLAENLIGNPGPVIANTPEGKKIAREAAEAYDNIRANNFEQATTRLKELGINTEGKTPEQLLELVRRRRDDYANNQVMFSFNDNDGVNHVATQIYSRMNPNQNKQTVVTNINGEPLSKGDFKDLFNIDKNDNVTGLKGDLYYSPQYGPTIVKDGELFPINAGAIDAVVYNQYIAPVQEVEAMLTQAREQVSPEELYSNGFNSYEQLVGEKLGINIPSMRRNAMDAISATWLSKNKQTEYKQE